MMQYKFINEMGMAICVKAETEKEAQKEVEKTQRGNNLPGTYRCVGFKVISPLVEQPLQQELFKEGMDHELFG